MPGRLSAIAALLAALAAGSPGSAPQASDSFASAAVMSNAPHRVGRDRSPVLDLLGRRPVPVAVHGGPRLLPRLRAWGSGSTVGEATCSDEPWKINASDLTATAGFMDLISGCAGAVHGAEPSAPTALLMRDAVLRITAGAREGSNPHLCANSDATLANGVMRVTGVNRYYTGSQADDLIVTPAYGSTTLCRNGKLRVKNLENTFANGLSRDESQSLSAKRFRGIGSAVVGTKVIFAGGYTVSGQQAKDTVDIFDLSSPASPIRTSTTWTNARYGVAGASCKHIAMFFGGWGGSNSDYVQNTINIYNNNTGAWTTDADGLETERAAGAATGVGSLIIFAGGRGTYSGGEKYVDIYNVDDGTWKQKNAELLSVGRSGLVALSVGTKAIFAGGGTGSGNKCRKDNCQHDGYVSDAVDIYDSSSDTWSTHQLSQARAFLAGAVHGTKAFFGGGDTDSTSVCADGTTCKTSKRVDIYDASTGAWTTTDFPAERTLMAAAASGKGVIFFGGAATRDLSDVSNDIFIYNVEADMWETDQMTMGRYGSAGVSFGDYAVFAGGYGSSGSDTPKMEILKYETIVTVYAVVNASSSEGNISGRYVIPMQIPCLGVNLSLPTEANVVTDHPSTDSWDISCNTTVHGKIEDSFSLATAEPVCIALNGQCPLAKYSPGNGAEYDISSCMKCPANMTTANLGSTIVSACKCNVGFTGPDGDGGTCVPCSAGKYKDAIGSASCTVCPVGKFSSTTGGTAISACLACPNGSTTASTGASLLSQCICKLGYTGPNGQACQACEAGKYKQAVGAAACTQCEAGKSSSALGAVASDVCTTCGINTFSSADTRECTACPQSSVSVEGSSAITACKCDKGFSGPDGSSCTSCSTGQYKNEIGDALCSNCTSNSDSASGSTGSSACICNAGFTGPNGGTCLACAAGKFKEAVGAAVCSNCTANSDSPAGSINGSACTCNAGFTGPDGQACQACEAGKYKQAVGAAACTQCEAGKSSSALGAVTSDVCTTCGINTFSSADTRECTACPQSSVSVEGSSVITACICDAGSTGPNGGNCVACTGGKFKTVNGTGPCSTCTTGTYAGAGMSACIDCPGLEFGSTSAAGSDKLEDCNCGRGLTAPSGQICQGCAIGKYKDVVGSAECTDCPQNSLSLSASISLTSCICKPGYTGSNGAACTACGFGEYKSSNGSATCSACPSGKYSDQISLSNEALCKECPSSNSTSPAKSGKLSDCTCNAGHTGPDGGICLACTAGKFKVSSGAAACTLCDSGKYSTIVAAKNSSACMHCPAGSVAVAGSKVEADCVCNLGHTGPAGGPCVKCPAGTFKEVTGDDACAQCAAGKHVLIEASISVSACVPCSAGTYSASNSSECLTCPLGSTSVAGSALITDCKCDTGQYLDGDGACTACPAGKYNDEFGQVGIHSCKLCDIGKFQASIGQTSCLKCSLGSNTSSLGATNASDCICGAGYWGDPPDGRSPCSSCKEGKYSTLIAATSNTTCLNCPLESTSPAASGVVTACSCNPGHTGLDGMNCSQCIAGTYKSFQGPQSCSLCGHGKFSGQVAQVDESTCVSCPPGTMSLTLGAVDNSTCQPCPVGTYMSGTGATACFDCPAKSISPAASSAITDCLCLPGFTGPAGQACNACSAGFYKVEHGETPCVSCPWNAESSVATSSVQQCLCSPGHTGMDEKNGNVCVPCAENTYKDSAGNTPCTSCPLNSASGLGSVSVMQCDCDVGYTSGDGGICVACKSGKVKYTAGRQSCVWPVGDDSGAVTTPVKAGLKLTGISKDEFISSLDDFKANIAASIISDEDAEGLQWGADSITVISVCVGTECTSLTDSAKRRTPRQAANEISVNYEVSVPQGLSSSTLAATMADPATVSSFESKMSESTGRTIGASYATPPTLVDQSSQTPSASASFLATPVGVFLVIAISVLAFLLLTFMMVRRSCSWYFSKDLRVPVTHLKISLCDPGHKVDTESISAGLARDLAAATSLDLRQILITRLYEVDGQDGVKGRSRRWHYVAHVHLVDAASEDVRRSSSSSATSSDKVLRVYQSLVMQSMKSDSALMTGKFTSRIIKINRLVTDYEPPGSSSETNLDIGGLSEAKSTFDIDWRLVAARLKRWTSREERELAGPRETSDQQNFVLSCYNETLSYKRLANDNGASRPVTDPAEIETGHQIVSGFNFSRVANEENVIIGDSSGYDLTEVVDKGSLAKLMWQAEMLAANSGWELAKAGTSTSAPEMKSTPTAYDILPGVPDSGLDDRAEPKPFAKAYRESFSAAMQFPCENRETSYRERPPHIHGGFSFQDSSTTIDVEDLVTLPTTKVQFPNLSWPGLAEARKVYAKWEPEPNIDEANEAEFDDFMQRMSTGLFTDSERPLTTLKGRGTWSTPSTVLGSGKGCARPTEIQNLMKSLEDDSELSSDDKNSIDTMLNRVVSHKSKIAKTQPIHVRWPEGKAQTVQMQTTEDHEIKSPRLCSASPSPPNAGDLNQFQAMSKPAAAPAAAAALPDHSEELDSQNSGIGPSNDFRPFSSRPGSQKTKRICFPQDAALVSNLSAGEVVDVTAGTSAAFGSCLDSDQVTLCQDTSIGSRPVTTERPRSILRPINASREENQDREAHASVGEAGVGADHAPVLSQNVAGASRPATGVSRPRTGGSLVPMEASISRPSTGGSRPRTGARMGWSHDLGGTAPLADALCTVPLSPRSSSSRGSTRLISSAQSSHGTSPLARRLVRSRPSSTGSWGLSTASIAGDKVCMMAEPEAALAEVVHVQDEEEHGEMPDGPDLSEPDRNVLVGADDELPQSPGDHDLGEVGFAVT